MRSEDQPVENLIAILGGIMLSQQLANNAANIKFISLNVICLLKILYCNKKRKHNMLKKNKVSLLFFIMPLYFTMFYKSSFPVKLV